MNKRITEPMDSDLSKCWKIVDRLKGEAENIEKMNKELREAVEGLINCISETRGTNATKALFKARAVLEKWK